MRCCTNYSSWRMIKEQICTMGNKMFVCHIDDGSRVIRGIIGIGLNLIALFFLDKVSPLFFWSIVIASYAILFEGFIGCSIMHWVYCSRMKKDNQSKQDELSKNK